MKSADKSKPSDNEIVSYFLKKPTGKRKTFALIKRITGLDLKPRHFTVVNQDIKIQNDRLLAGKISVSEAEKECRAILANAFNNELKRRGKKIVCPNNSKAKAEYFARRYPMSKRKNLDFKSVENETNRVLSILGDESIYSITQEKLQACIDDVEPSQQKRYVSRMNSILKSLGRTGIELYYTKTKKKRVSYIDQSDLEKLVKAIGLESAPIAGISQKDFSDFVVALYCTGMRIGEAIGIDKHDLFMKQGYVRVRQQLKASGKLDDTKNKRERKSIIISFGLEETKAWVDLDKSTFSRYDAAKYLTKKTKELFKDKNKYISLHGLRHSYAIHLLRVVEISISSVAAFLGDSIKTTEDYYIDHIVSDENIDVVRKKMNQAI